MNWLTLAPWLVAASLGAWGGYEALTVKTLRLEIVTAQEKAEKLVNEYRAADAERTAAIQSKHAADMALLQEKYDAAQTAILLAQVTNVCGDTPAGRAFLDGLRSLDNPGAGNAPAPTPGPRVVPR